jgi:hypothetical protein
MFGGLRLRRSGRIRTRRKDEPEAFEVAFCV